MAEQTEWCVVTGASCAGKSSLLAELRGRGFSVQLEVARVLLEEELSRGQPVDQVRADAMTFGRTVLGRQVRLEESLPVGRLSFLDRAIPDNLAFFRLQGLSTDEVDEASRRYRYRAVFMLDPLPFVPDGIRTESEEARRQLTSWLEEDYRGLGYPVVRVPALSVPERADLVLVTLAALNVGQFFPEAVACGS